MGTFKRCYELLSDSLDRMVEASEAAGWAKIHDKRLWKSIEKAEYKMFQACLQNRLNDLKMASETYERLSQKLMKAFDESNRLATVTDVETGQNYLTRLEDKRCFLRERVA